MVAKTNFKAARIAASLFALGFLSTYVLFIVDDTPRSWRALRRSSVEDVVLSAFASVVFVVGSIATWWRPQLGFMLTAIGSVIFIAAGILKSEFHFDHFSFGIIAVWFAYAALRDRSNLSEVVLTEPSTVTTDTQDS